MKRRLARWARRVAGFLLPSRGWWRCQRCRRPWYACKAHDVKLTLFSDFPVMCEPCWLESSLQQRLDATRALWTEWHNGGATVRLERMEAAVMADYGYEYGTPTALQQINNIIHDILREVGNPMAEIRPPETPELLRAHAAVKETEPAGQFVDWLLETKGATISVPGIGDIGERHMEKLLAEWQGLDPAKTEAEKRAILVHAREVQALNDRTR